MDSKGQLLPRDRRWVYNPSSEGKIVEFRVNPGDEVNVGDQLVLVNDLQLMVTLRRLDAEIKGIEREIGGLNQELRHSSKQQERDRIQSQITEKSSIRNLKASELDTMIQQNN